MTEEIQENSESHFLSWLNLNEIATPRKRGVEAYNFCRTMPLISELIGSKIELTAQPDEDELPFFNDASSCSHQRFISHTLTLPTTIHITGLLLRSQKNYENLKNTENLSNLESEVRELSKTISLWVKFEVEETNKMSEIRKFGNSRVSLTTPLSEIIKHTYEVKEIGPGKVPLTNLVLGGEYQASNTESKLQLTSITRFCSFKTLTRTCDIAFRESITNAEIWQNATQSADSREFIPERIKPISSTEFEVENGETTTNYKLISATIPDIQIEFDDRR